jgi:hypothetical protein
MRFIFILILLALSSCSYINKLTVKIECYYEFEHYNRDYQECISRSLEQYKKEEIQCKKIHYGESPTGLCNQIVD